MHVKIKLETRMQELNWQHPEDRCSKVACMMNQLHVILQKPIIYLVCRIGALATEVSRAICISTYLITGIYQKQETWRNRISFWHLAASSFPGSHLYLIVELTTWSTIAYGHLLLAHHIHFADWALRFHYLIMLHWDILHSHPVHWWSMGDVPCLLE